jgi:hypothetical protein
LLLFLNGIAVTNDAVKHFAVAVVDKVDVRELAERTRNEINAQFVNMETHPFKSIWASSYYFWTPHPGNWVFNRFFPIHSAISSGKILQQLIIHHAY